MTWVGSLLEVEADRFGCQMNWMDWMLKNERAVTRADGRSKYFCATGTMESAALRITHCITSRATSRKTRCKHEARKDTGGPAIKVMVPGLRSLKGMPTITAASTDSTVEWMRSYWLPDSIEFPTVSTTPGVTCKLPHVIAGVLGIRVRPGIESLSTR